MKKTVKTIIKEEAKKAEKKMTRKISAEQKAVNEMMKQTRKSLNALLKLNLNDKEALMADIRDIFSITSSALESTRVKFSLMQSVATMSEAEKEMLKQMLGMND